MDTKPIRVLHVLGGMNIGGAEGRTMDIYRRIDKSKVQFDFLVHTSEKCFYDDEILAMGGRIYSIPHISLRTIWSYIKSVRAFFDTHKEYQIIHGHATNGSFIYQWIAKTKGVPVRIAHARSAKFGKGIEGLIKKILCFPLRFFVTHQFAVSKLAGQSRFGRRNTKTGRVQVIPNSIELEKYAYNESVRQMIREKLGLGDAFVIGHVGRFHYAKNHEYLIDIFNELLKINSKFRLMLVGSGDLEGSIRKKAQALGISESILFLGNRTDVPELLQAMDLFVFPSRYEGLPGSVIEAQAAGLKCIVSDQVSDEVRLTDLVKFMSIKQPAKCWAEEILNHFDSNTGRRSYTDVLYQAGFDSSIQAKNMESFYLNVCNQMGEAKRKKNLLLLIPNFLLGGQQQVLLRTADIFKEDYNISIAALTLKDCVYDVPKGVIDLNIPSSKSLLLKAVNVFRRVVKTRKLKKELNIDVTISFGSTSNIQNVFSRYKDRVITTVQGYGSITSSFIGRVCGHWTYSGSDAVVCVSKKMSEDIIRYYHLRPERVHTVYNPYNTEEIINKSKEAMDGFCCPFPAFVAMGRFTRVKGYWHLIKAFSLVKQKYPQSRLYLIGDGDDKDRILSLVHQLDLTDDVNILGFQKNPFKYLSKCSVFVLSSLNEGFPNAVIEAMICGLPIISADCRTGPGEILSEHNRDKPTDTVEYAEYGILVPPMSIQESYDAQLMEPCDHQLAEAMIKLVGDRELYAEYRRKSPLRAADFSYENYYKEMKKIIEV